MSRPLPLLARAAIFLFLGTLAGLRLATAAFPVVAAAAALTLAAVLLLRPGRSAVAALSFLAGGIALGAAAAAASTADCRAAFPDEARLALTGIFEARPWPDAPARFRIDSAAGFPGCSGTVRVRLARGAAPLPAGGAPVGVRGRWLANPAVGAWPRPPERAGTLVVDSIRAAPAGAVRRHPLIAARASVAERLRALFGRRGALAEALILEERDGLDPAMRERFAASGLAHLLAVSGTHVMLLAGVTLLLFRLARIGGRTAALATGVATIAYVVFIGAPYAASRAALQATCLLLSRLLQRPADPWALLAAAAIPLLAFDPLAALNAGFQLSFTGIASIIALRRPFTRALHRLPRWLRDSLALSFATTLATAPIAALHFGQVAPIGILANLAAIPITGLAVPAAALALLASYASRRAGLFVADGAGLLLDALDRVASFAAAAPGGHAPVDRDTVLAWCAAAAIAFLFLHTQPARRLRPRMRRICAAGLALAVLLAAPAAAGRLRGPDLEIHVIDVGQGDAIAIRTPRDRWILVDAGARSASFDAGRARVAPYLLKHGARRLAVLVLTHPDADHIGGAPTIVRRMRPELVIDPGVPVARPLYHELLHAVEAAGVRWVAGRHGRTVHLDGVALRFLHPEGERLDATEDANDVSLVFRLEYGRFAALFTGDAPVDVEQRLVRRFGERLRADVLKVGHHGSTTSTAEPFLDAVAPRIALISVGRRNRYGHPAPAVLDRLQRRDIRVLRTDLEGSITVRVDGLGRLVVETAR